MKYEEFKKEYEKARKQHSLPSIDELNNEFNLQFSINKLDEMPLKLADFIIGQQLDFFGGYLNWTYSLIYGSPQSGIVNKEASFLNEKEKKQLVKTMYKITAITRLSPSIYLEESEKKYEWITKLLKQWLELKPQLLSLSQKIRTNWETTHVEYDPEKEFFG